MSERTIDSATSAYTAALPPALLTYVVDPRSVYVTVQDDHPSYVTLNVRILNDTDAAIACGTIRLDIPVGADGGSLTESPVVIATSLEPSRWTIADQGGGELLVLPVPPVTGLDAGESIAFHIGGIWVNRTEGAAPLRVTETTDQQRQASVVVSKVLAALAIKRFGATPAKLAPGQSTTLSWETTGAYGCTITRGLVAALFHDVALSAGSRDLAPNGQQTDTPEESTLYTLTAHGDGPDLSAQATVTVSNPSIRTFTASDTEVDPGGSVTLEWTTRNAEQCRLGPGGSTHDANGSIRVTPSETTTYELVAVAGDFESPAYPRTITVRAPDVSFGGVPSPDAPGVLERLSWSVLRAGQCSINQGIGDVDATGWRDVQPAARTSYRLTAAGTGGTRFATVDVVPPGWNDCGAASPPIFAPTLIAGPDKLILLGGFANIYPVSINYHPYHYTDATGWTIAAASPETARMGASGAYFNGRYWLVGGDGGRPLETGGGWEPAVGGDIVSSSDGATWHTVLADAPWGKRSRLACVAFQNALWVTGGSPLRNDVWRSVDGVSWDRVTAAAAWAGRERASAGVMGDVMFVAGGRNGQGIRGLASDVWTSRDGVEWTSMSMPAGPPCDAAVAGAVRGIFFVSGRSWAPYTYQLDSFVRNQAGVWSPYAPAVPWGIGEDSVSVATFQERLWVAGLHQRVWYFVV